MSHVYWSAYYYVHPPSMSLATGLIKGSERDKINTNIDLSAEFKYLHHTRLVDGQRP